MFKRLLFIYIKVLIKVKSSLLARLKFNNLK
jgi:hypothetical protein